jgi:cytochrome c oxidase cbb3-type subunit III
MHSLYPKALQISLLCIELAACEREKRDLTDQPSFTARSGDRIERTDPAGEMLPPRAFATQYQQNAFAMSQGKHLFEWFNCSGCHAHGGGSIGPALMDSDWIYGSSPGSIRETILDGRPNGMPAFRGHLSETQVWQLVAYVRSLSGQASKAASPSRSDTLQVKESEQSTPRAEPVASPAGAASR